MKVIFVHTISYNTLKDLRNRFPGAEIRIAEAVASEDTIQAIVRTCITQGIAIELK